MTFDLITSLNFLSGTSLSLFQFILIAFSALLVTKIAFRNCRITTLLAVFTVCIYWIPAAVFFGLIPFGLFNRTATTCCLLALCGLFYCIYGVNSKKAPLFEFGIFKEHWIQLSLSCKVLTYLVGLVLIVRLSRGLIAPPLAWDALTYHLLKAGRWVQAGGWVVDNAPDAWQFYQWFPPLGDVYWAWAMLGTHSDAWLAFTSGLIWMSCGAATYCLARVLNADRNVSWMAALAGVSVPAVLALLTAAYVDNTAMAIVMLGTALTMASIKERCPKLGVAGVTAMALAVGIKITFLPYFLVAATVLLFTGMTSGKRGLLPLVLSVPLICISLFWQFYLVYKGKTPFYPAPLSVAGFQIEAGQPEFLIHHFPKKFHLPYFWEVTGSIWRFLFETKLFSPNNLNFTWTFIVVFALGIIGLVKLLKSLPWDQRVVLAGLFCAGLAIFANFWLPSTTFYRGIWLSNMARFFTSWYALLLVLGLFSRVKFQNSIYAGLIIVNVFSVWPRRWGWMDVQTTFYGFVFLMLAGMAGYFIFKFRNRSAAWFTAIILLISVTVGISSTRDHWRFKYYKNTDQVYDTIRIGNIRVAGEAAEWLNQKHGLQINFTSNYNGIGYSWFRYMFLGSRFQNEVVYVTPTTDGSVWSQCLKKVKPIDYNSWNNRLKQAGVDYIVTIRPYAMETDWVGEHPERFKLLAEQKPERYWAFFRVLDSGKTKQSLTNEISPADTVD